MLFRSIGAGGEELAKLALTFVPPFHMYRQLKGAYGLTRLGTIWRWVLLLTFAAIAFSLFAVAVVLVGISD